MTGTIHYLRPRPRSIARYLRIGSTGHRRLEHLLDAGKLPAIRLAVDAASYDKQIDLIEALQAGRRDVLGDPYQALGDPPQPPECRMRGSTLSQSDHARRRP